MPGVSAGQAFVSILANTTELEQGLRRAQARLNSFGVAITKIGAGLLALGGSLSAPLAAGVKEFADFESSLARIDVLLDENTKSIGEFKNEIEDLAVKFGVEKEVLVRGFEDILQSMIPAEKATNVLNAALKASAIGFTDTATAVSALTTLINSYGIDADRAADLSDILFTTVRRGRISFEDLAINIGNVASIAKTAGVDVKELSAAIATITRNGIRAEDTITAIRAIMQTFLKPAEGAKEKAKEFGLVLSSTTLQSEGLIGALKKIQDLPPDVIGRIFPNIRALKGVIPIIKNLKGFDDDIQAIANSGGTVDERFQKITKTLNFMFNRILQIGKRALTIIGEALEDDVRRLGQAFVRFSSGVNKTLKANKGLIKTFSIMVVGIIATGSALIALGSAAFITAIGIGAVAASLSALVAILATMFSPLGVLIGLIVTLGVVVEREFGLIDKATMELVRQFTRLKDTFSESFKLMAQALKAGDLKTAFDVLVASVKLLWAKFIQVLVTQWEGFKADAGKIVNELAITILKGFNTALSAVQKIIVKVKTFFQNAFSELLGGAKKFFATFGNLVDTGTTKLNAFFDPEISDDVAKQVIEQNRKITEDKKRNIDDETTSNIEGNNKASQDELKKIEDAAATRLKALLIANNQINEEAKTQRDAAIQRAEAELQKAKEDLKKTADKAKEDLNEDVVSAVSPGISKKLKSFADKLKIPDLDLADTIKTSVQGSFSGFAIERASNQEAQIVKNTKQMADDIRRIKRNQEQGVGGATFQ